MNIGDYKDTDIREPIIIASKIYENSICVEVGVKEGNHAEVMENVMNPVMLYLVDPWEDQYKMYKRVVERFSNKDNIRVIKKKSYDASVYFKSDLRFDLVYIDGSHTYRNVLMDLQSWWPLIKEGGMVAGHDYNKEFSVMDNEKCGVREAVKDFAKTRNLIINLDKDQRNFWIFK